MEAIERARQFVAADPRNQPFENWTSSVLQGEHDDHPEVASMTEWFALHSDMEQGVGI